MLIVLKPRDLKRMKTSDQNGKEKDESLLESETNGTEPNDILPTEQAMLSSEVMPDSQRTNEHGGSIVTFEKNAVNATQSETTVSQDDWREPDSCETDKEETRQSINDLRNGQSDSCEEERQETAEREVCLQDHEADSRDKEAWQYENDLRHEESDFLAEEEEGSAQFEGDLQGEETDSCDEGGEEEPTECEGGLYDEENDSSNDEKEEEREPDSEKNDSPDKENEERHGIYLPRRPVIIGNRICDILHLIKSQNMAYELHKQKRGTSCSLLSYELYDHRDWGLKCRLTFRCNECLDQSSFWASPDPQLNIMSVAGSVTDGKPYENEKASFNAVNVPYLSFSSYMDIRLKKLCNVIESLAKKSMEQAAEEEKKLAVERGDVVADIPKAPVISDGAWGTRIYAHKGKGSLGGYAVIVGQHTGKVLDIRIKNKFCVICEKAERQGKEPRPHRCFRNWPADKPSSLMEAESIREAFESSMSLYGLIYSPLITDRDSCVVNAIRESNPYMSVGLSVKIVHCVNHLMRNLRKRVDTVKQMTGLGRIPHLREIIEKNKEPAVRCIYYAAKKRNVQETDFDTKIEDLRNDILAIPYHVYGDHSTCGAVTICKGASDDEVNEVELFTNNTRAMFESIVDIFDEMSQYSESFLLGYTNNPAEGVNSVSNKNISGKRVCYYHRDGYHTREYATVLQYNSRQALTLICEKICGRPYEFIVQMETDRARAVRNNNNYRNNKKAQGEPVKSRKKGCKDSGVYYGPQALRPDMSEDRYQRRLQKHYELLFEEQSKRDEIARKTLLQSGSDSWFDHRRTRLTASNFGEICRMREDTCPLGLLRRMQTSSKSTGPKRNSNAYKAMQYGIKMEKLVKEKLKNELKWPIQDTGLVIDAEIPFLAASPDALYGEDGIVEIKCSYAGLGLLPDDAIAQNKGGLRRVYNPDGTLREIHKHYHQVIGTLRTTGRKFCKFILATQLKEGGEIYLKETHVDYNERFWNEQMEPKMFRFYEKAERELLDQQISRQVAQEKAFNNKGNSNNDLQTDDPNAGDKNTNAADKEQDEDGETNAADADPGPPPPEFFLNEVARRMLIETPANLYETNVLSTGNAGCLNDQTLDAFLQILSNESGLDALSVMWLQCPSHVPACDHVPDTQILGGISQFHWMCVHYNGSYVLVYDSTYAANDPSVRTFKSLPVEVRRYLKTRYPNVPKNRVICLRVRERQPDGDSCGVRATAFATSVALGESPWLRNYAGSTELRKHLWQILNTRQLTSFPSPAS